MKILCYDIETDGLLLDATKVHCVVVKDLQTNVLRKFGPHEIVQAYKHLLTADIVLAHNGVMFDSPTLYTLVGEPNGLPELPKCFDTILVSRLIWPDSKGEHPAGGHSLEKWAEFLGLKKLHTDIEDWSTYTPQMLERCVSDVEATAATHSYILPHLSGRQEAVDIEHRTAEIITKQIQNGFPVNMKKVEALHQELSIRLAELEGSFSHIPPWVHYEEQKKAAYWYSSDENGKLIAAETKGKLPRALQKNAIRGPNKLKRVETIFNPNSGSHKARLFIEQYGWRPVDVGAPSKWFPNGVPTTDKKTMASLDYPEAQTFTKISKTSKLLSTYTRAWVEHHRNARIHGDVITNGAVSGRMTHSTPNLNVPKIKKSKSGAVLFGEEGGWGYECRDCFICRKGWSLVGADASGLELRMLAHYLYQWDKGNYADIVLNGDVHEANRQAAGLPTRDNAKTFIYAWLYGGGDAKIGQIVKKGRVEGKKLKKQFLTALPAVRELVNWVKPQQEITGLDGRPLPVRSNHMAMNTLLQSAGAVIMKKALCIFYDKAVHHCGPHGVSWALCANVHDEIQAEAAPVIAPLIGQLIVDSIREAGEHFKLNIRLDGEFSVGESWATTH